MVQAFMNTCKSFSLRKIPFSRKRRYVISNNFSIIKIYIYRIVFKRDDLYNIREITIFHKQPPHPFERQLISTTAVYHIFNAENSI